MVCELCESVKRLAPDDATRSSAAPGTCERCGRPLERDSLEQMTAKVAQLARFGLTGRPLLAKRRV